MAVTVTNRYKYLLATGGIVPGTTNIRMGLLGGTALGGTQHTAVRDVNTVTELLAISGVSELSGVASYSRQAVTGGAATEDDANDWALIDSSDVSFGALETGGTIVGYFLYIEGASDTARQVLQVGDLTSTPTNGGTITITTPSGLTRLT